MEVHHPHHIPKKLKEYLTEFLMLFAAVTLGFLAENQREHYVEKLREKELATNLYMEMRADSIDLEKVIQFRIRKENYLNYLYENYAGDVDDSVQQKKFQIAKFLGVTANSAITFEPRQAILKQLESSGMLRYFKDTKLQFLLLDIINQGEVIKTRMVREVESYQIIVLPNFINYSDMDLIRLVTKNGGYKESVIASYDRYAKSDKFYRTKKFILGSDEQFKLRRSFEYYRFLISSTRINQLEKYKEITSQILKQLREIYEL